MNEPSCSIRIQKTRFEIIRGYLEIAAILAAGCWAFYTFVYQEQLKPAQEPPSATRDVDLKRTKTTPSVDFIEVGYTMRKTSKGGIDVICDALNVYGERIDPKKRPIPDSVSSSDMTIDRSVPIGRSTLVYGSGILRDGAQHGHVGYHVSMRKRSRISIAARSPGSDTRSSFVARRTARSPCGARSCRVSNLSRSSRFNARRVRGSPRQAIAVKLLRLKTAATAKPRTAFPSRTVRTTRSVRLPHRSAFRRPVS